MSEGRVVVVVVVSSILHPPIFTSTHQIFKISLNYLKNDSLVRLVVFSKRTNELSMTKTSTTTRVDEGRGWMKGVKERDYFY